MVRIVIADDSDAIRMVMKDILNIGQHELVAEATNGIEAVEAYVKSKPDVLLLDMAMPKKDGLTALKEIIVIDPNANIVMITASDNQQTMKECMNAGARAYILKPFNFQEVLDIISQVEKS